MININRKKTVVFSTIIKYLSAVGKKALSCISWCKNKLEMHSNLLISFMALMVSICSFCVTKTQADLAAIALYPHFEVVQQTDDTDNDRIHDTAYISVNNRGGNYYAFNCSLTSFFRIRDCRESAREYLIPVDGLFVIGRRSYESPLVYTKMCDLYLNFAHIPYELETKNCYYESIQTYVKITYQNIDLKIVEEYFDSRTGRRLSKKEGEYYFDQSLKPNSYNDFYSNHRLYAHDSAPVILDKINSILNSNDEMASAFLIPPYQEK